MNNVITFVCCIQQHHFICVYNQAPTLCFYSSLSVMSPSSSSSASISVSLSSAFFLTILSGIQPSYGNNINIYAYSNNNILNVNKNKCHIQRDVCLFDLDDFVATIIWIGKIVVTHGTGIIRMWNTTHTHVWTDTDGMSASLQPPPL